MVDVEEAERARFVALGKHSVRPREWANKIKRRPSRRPGSRLRWLDPPSSAPSLGEGRAAAAAAAGRRYLSGPTPRHGQLEKE